MLLKCVKHIKELHDDRSGAASVEFAIVAISAIALLPIIWDMSSVINASMALSGSMRAGVQYALTNPNASTGISTVIKNASGFPVNNVTVTTTQACNCSGTTVNCGTTCTGGVNPVMNLTITANYSVPTMIPYASYPNNNFPISSTTNVRVQ